MPFIFLYFGLPVIAREFGASALQVGGLFSVFTGTTLLLRPAVGWAMDRLGGKLFFVAALFLYTLAMGLFAFADSLTWLYVARLFQGMGSAFLWTAANTIVASLTEPGKRGQAMGRLNEITTRGGLVGTLAAAAALSVLGDGPGWKLSFLAFATFTFAGAMLAWRTLPGAALARPALAARTAVSSPLLRLLLIVFITGVPAAMLAPIYLTYLQDKFSTDMMTLGLAFFPAGLATAFLAARLGAVSDRYGRAPVMALGMAGSGLTSLLLPHLTSLLWLAVLYTLSTVMLGLSSPAEAAMVADLTGDERRGLAYGLYDFASNLGFTIGPLLGGALYDVIGANAPFYLNGAFLMVGAVLVVAFLRNVPKING
jgi:MFS family permease